MIVWEYYTDVFPDDSTLLLTQRIVELRASYYSQDTVTLETLRELAKLGETV